jgi:phospholipase C
MVMALGTWRRRAGALVGLAILAAAIWIYASPGATPTEPLTGGIHKIQHVIVIMQENRSFDSYFGTYPGADGIPMKHGHPTVCIPDPALHHCVRPFHDTSLVNDGGPHSDMDSRRDVAGGKMNGFVPTAFSGRQEFCKTAPPDDPRCTGFTSHNLVPDVMGYHTAREIPNYWAYAKNYVLQDHMFEPVASWSLPSHMWMVSAWSARCASPTDPLSCHTDIGLGPRNPPPPGDFPWTDLTWLLYTHQVSWGYYVGNGGTPDCPGSEMFCLTKHQAAGTPGIWNPLPKFEDVNQDGQLGNVRPVRSFLQAARTGNLPNVSWIVPDQRNSEHPPASVRTGEAYVTRLVNAVMRSPEWSSTAIFVSWDDWGGFYDHMAPPRVDEAGYGIRVPGLMISPYAKTGTIDHQTLSFDAYMKFIEDDFLGGQRIDPATDGRPDSRPSIREDSPMLGNLAGEFDFSQPPQAPMLLDPTPPLARVHPPPHHHPTSGTKHPAHGGTKHHTAHGGASGHHGTRGSGGAGGGARAGASGGGGTGRGTGARPAGGRGTGGAARDRNRRGGRCGGNGGSRCPGGG